MTTEEVVAAFVQVHREVQTKSGRDPEQVVGTACPLTDIPGFKSLLIPQTVRMVARKLGVDIKKGDLRNIYVSNDGTKRKLTFSEIADCFIRRYVKVEAQAAGAR